MFLRGGHQPQGSHQAHHDALSRLLPGATVRTDCLPQRRPVRARQGVGGTVAKPPVASVSWQAGTGPGAAVSTE